MMPTDELVEEWQSHMWLTYIQRQTSNSVVQRINAIEREFLAREPEIEKYELRKWFDQEKAEHDKAEAERVLAESGKNTTTLRSHE